MFVGFAKKVTDSLPVMAWFLSRGVNQPITQIGIKGIFCLRIKHSQYSVLFTPNVVKSAGHVWCVMYDSKKLTHGLQFSMWHLYVTLTTYKDVTDLKVVLVQHVLPLHQCRGRDLKSEGRTCTLDLI